MLGIPSGLWLASSEAIAGPTGESDFLAARLTGEEISLWLGNLPNVPKTVGIFAVKTSAPLDPDFANVIEAEVSKYLQGAGVVQTISCTECRAPQVQVKGDRLVVTKGAPDMNTMRELGRKLGVESFLILDCYRTKLSLLTQAGLYDVGSGQVLASEMFKVPALDISDSATQVILKVGPGLVFGGGSSGRSATSSAPPLGGNLMILEELGFGKGGLNIGAFTEPGRSPFLHLSPTLSWRGRFGSSALYSLKSLGAGFGFSGSKYGVAVTGAYDVFLGSFTVIGIHGGGLIPVKDTSTGKGRDTVGGFAAISIGIALGR